MQSKSIMNPGNMFILAYCLYFLITPIIFYIDTVFNIGLNMDNLIFLLYQRKGLRFLTPESLYLIVSGLVSFVIGYYFVIKANKNINIRFLNNSWPYKNILIGSALLFLAGTISKINGVIKGAHLHFHFSDSLIGSNLVAFFSSLNVLHLASLSLLVLGYFISKGDNNKTWSLRFSKILFVAYPVLFLISLNFGGKMTTIAIIFSLVVIWSYFIKNIKKQVRLLVILIVATFAVMIAKGFVANYIDNRLSESVQVNQSMTIQDVINKNKGVMNSLVGRVNMTHIFTEISLRNNGEVGTSESSIIDKFIKKISKNEISGLGNLFGRQYGFVASTDQRTGVGKTIIGGFYLQYGAYGVLLGMFFIGVLFSLIGNTTFTNVGLFFYSLILTRLMARIEMDVFNLLWDIGLYSMIAFLTHIMIMENGTIDKFLSIRKNRSIETREMK
jgi:hypothetical protein